MSQKFFFFGGFLLYPKTSLITAQQVSIKNKKRWTKFVIFSFSGRDWRIHGLLGFTWRNTRKPTKGTVVALFVLYFTYRYIFFWKKNLQQACFYKLPSVSSLPSIYCSEFYLCRLFIPFTSWIFSWNDQQILLFFTIYG